MTARAPVRVLIVDDSAIVRKVLSSILEGEEGIDVVGTAPDPYVARDKILAVSPDVLTLDIEMPRMDGLTFLDRLMVHHPLPVIVLSSLAESSSAIVMEALRRGAVDVIPKPGGPYSVGDLRNDLPQRIRAAANARVQRRTAAPVETFQPAPVLSARQRPASPEYKGPVELIVIGASTGGTVAIEDLLRKLPAGMPPIAIVQHIPAGFSAAFAHRLDSVCAIRVEEATDFQTLAPGMALVAPGNRHMQVERCHAGFRVRLSDGPKICYQRPAVDILFRSAAALGPAATIAIILTGMGNDGAEAMQLLRGKGAYTMAQDEKTSVVYGMPREAVRLGAIVRSASPAGIGAELLQRCHVTP